MKVLKFISARIENRSLFYTFAKTETTIEGPGFCEILCMVKKQDETVKWMSHLPMTDELYCEAATRLENNYFRYYL